MRFKKTLGLALSATILLAACNNDNEHIDSYSQGLEDMQRIESPIQEVSQEMNKLEKDKESLMKKVSGSNIPDVQDEVQKVLDDDQKIEEQLDKEQSTMKKSKQKFEEMKKESNQIEDEETKKEFDEFNKAMDDKYDKHKTYIEGYQNVLDKEKDLFQYFQGQSGNQEMVDQKSETLSKAQKDMSGKVKDYTDAVKNAQKEQRDIQQYLDQ